MKFHSVAIDGPAGAGKSTLARRAAKELGFLYVDTGAIYRTVALKMIHEQVDVSQPSQVAPHLKELDIRMDYDASGEQRMFLDGADVSDAIREHRVSDLTSQVAVLKEVRAFLLELQRKMAREHNVIMDGRDIGTVVLPAADVKIFLTASPEARAKRRVLELENRGQIADFDVVLHDIIDRDERDRSRPIAPLCRAEDAFLLDTTELNFTESLEALLSLIKENLSL